MVATERIRNDAVELIEKRTETDRFGSALARGRAELGGESRTSASWWRDDSLSYRFKSTPRLILEDDVDVRECFVADLTLSPDSR